ncbi:hypothetical protein LCGC14_1867720, partial [marine sediment metagenome]
TAVHYAGLDQEDELTASLACHRYNDQTEKEFGGAGVFHEDVLCDLADIRLLSPLARARSGFTRFRDRHRDTLADTVLQSCRLNGEDIDGLFDLANVTPAIRKAT